MNVPDDNRNALHDVLHRAVDQVHASPELAERVEHIARRRRAVRRGAVSALALVAVGTTAGLLATIHPAASGAASSYSNKSGLPVCAARVDAYVRYVVTYPSTAPQAGPLVPGDPDAAVLCRYAGSGETQPFGILAGSATVTDKTQLDQLQNLMNRSQLVDGIVNCPDEHGDTAIVIFAYPHGGADRVVNYDPECRLLHTVGGAVYWARGDLDQLVTGLTGSWQRVASSATR